MRQPEEMGFYAVKNADGTVSGCHAVRDRAPAESIEISESDYLALCSSKRHDRIVADQSHPQIIVALAEADKKEVQNIIAAIVEETTVDHRGEINALTAKVDEKFAEYDAVFSAIRNEAGKFKDEVAT